MRGRRLARAPLFLSLDGTERQSAGLDPALNLCLQAVVMVRCYQLSATKKQIIILTSYMYMQLNSYRRLMSTQSSSASIA